MLVVVVMDFGMAIEAEDDCVVDPTAIPFTGRVDMVHLCFHATVPVADATPTMAAHQ